MALLLHPVLRANEDDLDLFKKMQIKRNDGVEPDLSFTLTSHRGEEVITIANYFLLQPSFWKTLWA